MKSKRLQTTNHPKPIPSLVFVFLRLDAVAVCAHCHRLVDVSDGKPLTLWGMNSAPLHRACCDAYISAQGWEPAIMPGINIYKLSDGEA